MKKALALVAIGIPVLIAAFIMPAESKSRYTLKTLLDSKTGDPIYKYKVAACFWMDAELVVRSSWKGKSLLLDDTQFNAFRDGFAKRYQLVDKRAFDDLVNSDATHLIVDKHFRQNLFQTDEGIEEFKQSCRRSMLSIVDKSLLEQSESPEKPKDSIEVDKDAVHKECLEARDYDGCMRYKAKEPVPIQDKVKKDTCFASGWCVAESNEPDQFGFPKLKGWLYRYRPEVNSIEYYDVTMSPARDKVEKNWYKVRVRGEYGRYISTRNIYRRTRPGRAATPGSTTTIGGSSTDCRGYDDGVGSLTMDCTTQGPTVIQSPGIAGRPAQNLSETLHSIIDCKDFTFVRRWVSASPRANSKEGKWQKVSTRYFGDLTEIRQVCSRISTLPPSTYLGYE